MTFQFQSTLRRTERPNCSLVSTYFGKISIHAPTNGATSGRYELVRYIFISIHAPANGATCCCETQRAIDGVFQSTLRRTERQDPVSSQALRSSDFNPRSGERSDSQTNISNTCDIKFQSTLRRTERRG